MGRTIVYEDAYKWTAFFTGDVLSFTCNLSHTKRQATFQRRLVFHSLNLDDFQHDKYPVFFINK